MTLFDPDKKSVAIFSYDDATENTSYVFIDNVWKKTGTPSPGNENILSKTLKTNNTSQNKQDDTKESHLPKNNPCIVSKYHHQ